MVATFSWKEDYLFAILLIAILVPIIILIFLGGTYTASAILLAEFFLAYLLGVWLEHRFIRKKIYTIHFLLGICLGYAVFHLFQYPKDNFSWLLLSLSLFLNAGAFLHKRNPKLVASLSILFAWVMAYFLT